MATTKGTKRLPAQVAKARALMEGQEITGDTLKATLGSGAFNVLANSFRSGLSPAAKEMYREQAATDRDRRDWIAQYVLDPETTTKVGYNRTEAFKSNKNVADELWLTEEQLGSAQFLNSTAQAKVLCESGDLTSREHENPSLAALGIKQYMYVDKKVRREDGTTEIAGVSATTSELTTENYNEVREHIAGSFGKPAQKRKAPPRPKEEESPEVKKFKAECGSRTVALRKCKALTDKASSDIGACKTYINKLNDKGYPAAIVEFMSTNVSKFQENVADAQKVYAAAIIKISKDMAIDDMIACREATEKAIASLELTHGEFKKGTLTDAKKLSH